MRREFKFNISGEINFLCREFLRNKASGKNPYFDFSWSKYKRYIERAYWSKLRDDINQYLDWLNTEKSVLRLNIPEAKKIILDNSSLFWRTIFNKRDDTLHWNFTSYAHHMPVMLICEHVFSFLWPLAKEDNSIGYLFDLGHPRIDIGQFMYDFGKAKRNKKIRDQIKKIETSKYIRMRKEIKDFFEEKIYFGQLLLQSIKINEVSNFLGNANTLNLVKELGTFLNKYKERRKTKYKGGGEYVILRDDLSPAERKQLVDLLTRSKKMLLKFDQIMRRCTNTEDDMYLLFIYDKLLELRSYLEIDINIQHLGIYTESYDIRDNLIGNNITTTSCTTGPTGRLREVALLNYVDPYIGLIRIVGSDYVKKKLPIGEAYVFLCIDENGDLIWLIDSVETSNIFERLKIYDGYGEEEYLKASKEGENDLDKIVWPKMILDAIIIAAKCLYKKKYNKPIELKGTHFINDYQKLPKRIEVNVNVINKRAREFVYFVANKNNIFNKKIDLEKMPKKKIKKVGGIEAIKSFAKHHYMECFYEPYVPFSYLTSTCEGSVKTICVWETNK